MADSTGVFEVRRDGSMVAFGRAVPRRITEAEGLDLAASVLAALGLTAERLAEDHLASLGHYMLMIDNGDGTSTFIVDGDPVGVLPGGLNDLASATAALFPEALQHIEDQAILIERDPDGGR